MPSPDVPSPAVPAAPPAAAAAAAAAAARAAAMQRAISRAQWSVIQTGLITTGLALFGIYVLASRINNVNAMEFYLPGWFPLGAWVAGTIAGGGYVAGSWWNGLRVRRGLLASVLGLQLLAYAGAHYAEFAAMDLIYRDTGERPGFFSYFHIATMNLGGDEGPLGPRGYVIRAAEVLVFCLGGLATVVVQHGKPRCGACPGTPERYRLGTVPRERVGQAVGALETFARTGDAARLQRSMREHERAAEATPATSHRVLVLTRCGVCGAGYVEAEAEEEEESTAAVAAVGAGATGAVGAANGTPRDSVAGEAIRAARVERPSVSVEGSGGTRAAVGTGAIAAATGAGTAGTGAATVAVARVEIPAEWSERLSGVAAESATA